MAPAVGSIDGLVSEGPYAYGRMHGRDGNNSLRAGSWKPVDDASAFITWSSGQMQAPPPHYGVWAKSHYVIPPYRHAAIRIIPSSQSKWLATPNPWHVYFAAPKMKRYGDLAFATVGGGPSGGTWSDPLGYLETRFNSDTDINKNTVDRAERLAVGALDSAITKLFTLAAAFDNQTLDYEPTPQTLSNGYNSNSYLRGLLQAAQLPEPTFPILYLGDSPLFPGWFKPVPGVYFGVQP